MTAEYILAVDQGTSSTKCIVFNDRGIAMASASSVISTRYGLDGTAEQDPDEIYRSVIAAATATVDLFETNHSLGRDLITCVGIANQRESFVLWNVDGNTLHDAVVWQCKRSVDICRELKKDGMEDEIRSRTGLIIDPYFSGTKVTWLRRNNERVADALRSGEVFFGTIDSWLLYRLTDGSVHATDHSNASRTLLFNINTLAWDDEMARILGVTGLRYPIVHPSAHQYGESKFEGLFAKPVPITGMIGDSHAAFFGGRCFSKGSAKATLGTGCSILLNAGSEAPPSYPSTMSTMGFTIPGRVDYAFEGIIVSAGAVLTWLQHQLGLYYDPSELEQIAGSLDDSGGVVVVPGHAGLGAPFWQMDATGSIHGLTFGSSKYHVIRAALECIPFQIRAILDAVVDESGTRYDSIRVDGGISRNQFVIQWLSDTLGVPVNTFAMPDVTTQGAAFLAGLGSGVYSSISQIEELDINESIHEPGTGVELAAQAYVRWREVVNQSRHIATNSLVTGE